MPFPPASATSISNPLSDAPVSLSSVIICGWIDWKDDVFLPEVWHVELTPIERIRKLDVAPIVEQLDQVDSQANSESDLRTAVMIDDRLFLLGSRPEARKTNLVYNVYFEVPLRRLCS